MLRCTNNFWCKMLLIDKMENEKKRASSWFQELRDEIINNFETLEDNQIYGKFSKNTKGKFKKQKTIRPAPSNTDWGGGEMAIMRDGRLFEKVGVNISTVYGSLSKEAVNMMTETRNLPNLKNNPSFWASGISLVAHMQNPLLPAIHMNTRMFWTEETWWFGGGSDLNPCIEDEVDTKYFHKMQKQFCDKHDLKFYPEYKIWADKYFYIPHRKRARGVGGIFFDEHNTGNWEKDFAFTQDVGRAFLPAFTGIIDKKKHLDWNSDDKEKQLLHRGLYAEYNLIYDRGTKFGLATGHDPDAVLMSLPPMAKWS
jgi:coproporphyrinogen III oxidase